MPARAEPASRRQYSGVDQVLLFSFAVWFAEIVVPGGGVVRQDLRREIQAYLRTAALSRAERLRGLAATSASAGRTGLRVRILSEARWPQVQTGC